MQGTYVDGGGTGLLAMVFGLPKHDSNNYQSLVGAPLLSTTSDFFNNSMNMINTAYRGDETLNIAKNIVLRHGSVYDIFSINLIDRNNITRANTMMQTVIASHPEIIRLSNRGFIDGYANINPSLDLHEIITDGDVIFSDDIMEFNTLISSDYSESDYDDLTKEVIRRTWDTVQELLADGIDPTSEDLLPF